MVEVGVGGWWKVYSLVSGRDVLLKVEWAGRLAILPRRHHVSITR